MSRERVTAAYQCDCGGGSSSSRAVPAIIRPPPCAGRVCGQVLRPQLPRPLPPAGDRGFVCGVSVRLCQAVCCSLPGFACGACFEVLQCRAAVVVKQMRV